MLDEEGFVNGCSCNEIVEDDETVFLKKKSIKVVRPLESAA